MDFSKSSPLCPPIAHVRQSSEGFWLLHPLADHLEGTANLAESFAKCFGNGDWAHLAGLWHDLGKFNPGWQAYGDHKSIIQRLLDEIRVVSPSRDRMRKLQRFTVNLPERAFIALQKRGEIMEHSGIWAQAVDGLYDPILGLCPDGAAWNPDTYVL